MPDEVEVETVLNDQPANDNVGEEVAVDHSSDAPELPNRAEVESKVSAGLAAVFGDEATPESAEEVKDDEPGVETPVDDKAEAAVDEPGVETSATQTPTLPAEFQRTLKAYGWSDEEIAANSKQYGTKFLETAQKLHASRSAEIAKWADLGRAEKIRQTEAAKHQPAPIDPYSGQLKPIDAAALKKVYGETELIDALVGPLNDTVNRINAVLPVIQQTQQASESAKLEALNNQINSFFGSDDLKPYAEVFGKNNQTLTEKQIEQRNKVLENADALLYGAKQQGRQLSANDALTLAFDAVSGEFKEQAARKTLTKQLKTRANGISLKPGGVKSAPAKGNPKADLEKRVSQGLAAVFR